jgi:alkylhydroperoxidase/carboxymuconolactone decarboxylase family protein YurZ
MPPSHADVLKNVAKLSTKEFTRMGFQIFEKPARQLFDHNQRGELVARQDIEHNQRELATIALSFQHCSASYNLKQSLRASANGSSLVHSAGCKVLFVVQFAGSTVELVGVAVVVNLKEDVMEQRHLTAMANAGVRLPQNGLFLELICAKPKTGAATLLLLSLLNKLSKQFDSISCNPTNERARNLFARHGYQAMVPTRDDLAILDRSTAAGHASAYFRMLPGYDNTVRLCTRGGIRDPSKTYWDCGR